jgi:hypothetical protein
MTKIVKGNLITLAEQGHFDGIVQGCNCMCTMGSGLAKEIKDRYPGAWRIDFNTDTGDINKLGNWSEYDTGLFTIFNCYTQYDFNRGGKINDVFEYASFEVILKKLAHLYPEYRWGLPRIGQGLAGGDSERINAMIDWFADTVEHSGGTVTIVDYDPAAK